MGSLIEDPSATRCSGCKKVVVAIDVAFIGTKAINLSAKRCE
jgi:hypothetical protein